MWAEVWAEVWADRVRSLRTIVDGEQPVRLALRMNCDLDARHDGGGGVVQEGGRKAAGQLAGRTLGIDLKQPLAKLACEGSAQAEHRAPMHQVRWREVVCARARLLNHHRSERCVIRTATREAHSESAHRR